MGIGHPMIAVGDRVVLDGEHGGVITNVTADKNGRPKHALIYLAEPMDGKSWARVDVSSYALEPGLIRLH